MVEINAQKEIELMCNDFEIKLKSVQPDILGAIKNYISDGVIYRGEDQNNQPIIKIKLSSPVSVFGDDSKKTVIDFKELSGLDHEKIANVGDNQKGTSIFNVISSRTGIILRDLRNMKHRDILKLETVFGFLC